MDCEQIAELIDAYSLGAAEKDEAATLEEHVADCVRCWSSLNEAQRTAATLALSTAFERAPDSLRARILADAERFSQPSRPAILERLKALWPVGAGALAATAAASLAFAVFLQAEVSDIRGDNDRLVSEIDTADARLNQQQQLMAVLAAGDVQTVSLEPTDPTSDAAAVYHWSGATQSGALLCNKLPPLEEGEVYQVWFLTDGESYPAGSFETWDGIGQIGLSLDDLPERPVAIGVSVDSSIRAREPEEIVLLAEFRE